MLPVPLGVISSPFLLAATLNYHLENHGSKTALEIKKNFYIDNIILSSNGAQEAFKIHKEMKEIFKRASMNIGGFFLNDNEFNKLVPENDRSRDQSLENEDLRTWSELTNQWPTRVKAVSRKPADIATIDSSPNELAQSEVWWNRPDWLKDEELAWPQWEHNICYEEIDKEAYKDESRHSSAYNSTLHEKKFSNNAKSRLQHGY
ncbi:unnamed protein product [Acanthocheilonema viteae]|uniref:Reverse transcriptase domain-containing protein n=1 Tax=Acanthocheilonema viteae TaxID=6277 RepID=A0A498SKC3_ACAVI|nr:unnamed protein product [Acanthocheilonema viteae]